MEGTSARFKTLKLKYGEYYSLKITDSGKNVINNVEITGNQITTEQKVFSEATYSDRVACHFVRHRGGGDCGLHRRFVYYK